MLTEIEVLYPCEAGHFNVAMKNIIPFDKHVILNEEIVINALLSQVR